MEYEMNNLYNEDCLEAMKKIPDKSIDMILCDLPYGTTACSWDEIIPLDKLWIQYHRIIKDDGAIVLFGSQPFTSKLVMSNIENFKYEWIWEKQKASNFLTAKYQPLKYHENILVFSKSTSYYEPQLYKVLEIDEIMMMDKKQLENVFIKKEYDRFGKIDKRINVNDCKVNKDVVGIKINRTRKKDNGLRYPKSVLKINKEVNSNIHPTQKPTELLEYLIKTYSKENELVLDNCMGSGSTAIACINTKRNFIGFELDKEYYDLACKRLEARKNQMDIFNMEGLEL